MKLRRSCIQCGDPLAADAGPRRAFCSVTCRTRRHRQRHREALAGLRDCLAELRDHVDAEDRETHRLLDRAGIYLGRADRRQ
ncbi:hypothetical protein E7744_02785 [Citricoccus sp. SGAir0253]|uniref:hypothetical protein n=1 Tax=Citricoccus sp. SGAir0253 TaxID=2567881 RepID=UPI0010CCDE15|nr:hypothetical protein [Citricoccus sp. SGAir0253]QCU77262.1 hypothetical protein E7744_02785 [Citricoccus sp. SGAir0253]